MEQVLAWVHVSRSHADIIGYVAAALVLTTFSVRSMRALRLSAITSNLAFICYAAVVGLLPILILHSVLLPVNLFRLAQAELERRRGPMWSFSL